MHKLYESGVPIINSNAVIGRSNNIELIITLLLQHNSNNSSKQVVVSVTLLVARRTNNQKVVGSMPAEVVCITVDRANCPLWPATTPSSEL